MEPDRAYEPEPVIQSPVYTALRGKHPSAGLTVGFNTIILAARGGITVALITIQLPEHAFSNAKKREMIEKVTDAMVAIEGEAVRGITWVLIREIKRCDWGIGGVSQDDCNPNHQPRIGNNHENDATNFGRA